MLGFIIAIYYKKKDLIKDYFYNSEISNENKTFSKKIEKYDAKLDAFCYTESKKDVIFF